MPRKTDSSNPADWLWIAASDLELIQLAAEQEIGYAAARSKLAEVLEKVMKAELIRTGWPLEKTHDLERLLEKMVVQGSDLAESFATLCESLAEVYFTNRYPGSISTIPTGRCCGRRPGKSQHFMLRCRRE